MFVCVLVCVCKDFVCVSYGMERECMYVLCVCVCVCVCVTYRLFVVTVGERGRKGGREFGMCILWYGMYVCV